MGLSWAVRTPSLPMPNPEAHAAHKHATACKLVHLPVRGAHVPAGDRSTSELPHVLARTRANSRCAHAHSPSLPPSCSPLLSLRRRWRDAAARWWRCCALIAPHSYRCLPPSLCHRDSIATQSEPETPRLPYTTRERLRLSRACAPARSNAWRACTHARTQKAGAHTRGPRPQRHTCSSPERV